MRCQAQGDNVTRFITRWLRNFDALRGEVVIYLGTNKLSSRHFVIIHLMYHLGVRVICAVGHTVVPESILHYNNYRCD